MFKNRWGAVGFVCLIAFGAANLVGSEDDKGVLQSAADELTQSKADFDARSSELAEIEERPVIVADSPTEFADDEDGFVSDDYLIDNAQGLAPVPDMDVSRELDSYAGEGDAVIIVNDDEIDQ